MAQTFVKFSGVSLVSPTAGTARHIYYFSSVVVGVNVNF